MSYKLSATLEGHEDDVKALVSPFNDTIVSASRDSTVRVWTKSSSTGQWESTINYRSNGFVNALAFDMKDSHIISAGQDKLINITDLSSHSLDPSFVLIGHESNVCCLDAKDDLIMSGSWDTTAKVWKDNQLQYTLKGHNASVWDVKIIDEETFLTSSADRTIKLWRQDKEIKNIVGHSDVVRGLALLPDNAGFISTSNDGTIKLWDTNGVLSQELVGHESFVYSVKLLSNGDIVSSGEDRTIRIWRNGQALQVITVPSISVWSVSVLPNDDIVAGGSDGVVRVFTSDPERFASEEELSKFKETVESIAINSQQVDESQIRSPEALDAPGSKEGQVIIVKSLQGINEAHQWSNGTWIKVGEVVGGAGSSDKKTEYDGKKWDYVFDVDIEDGAPPLKLPYNVNENPFVAAQRFLEKNELPSSFQDQVVNFITTNTSSVAVNNNNANPYVQSKPRLLPHTQYLGFTASNPDAILKGIAKFNSNGTFTENDLTKIKSYFANNNTGDLLTVARNIIDNWENKLVGYDILRQITPTLEKPPQHLGEFIKIGLTPSNPQVYFMTLRFLCNCFLNTKWGDAIITDPKIATSVITLLKFDASSAQDSKISVHIANALATLLLNYSIYVSRYRTASFRQALLAKFNEVAVNISQVTAEAGYRLGVAFGNLIYVDRELKTAGQGQDQNGLQYDSLKTLVLQRWGSEARFVDLFEEIDKL